MAHLYIDENLPLEVASGLRERGHNVLTAYEAGIANQGVSDEDVLAFAVRQQRAVVTVNRRDFIRLHLQQPSHAGIIVCTQDGNFVRQADLIHQLLERTPSLNGVLLRVVRPQK